jgi:hypothetical protein
MIPCAELGGRSNGRPGGRGGPRILLCGICENYGTQLAALREIAKILGINPTDKNDSENENKTFKIDISAIPHRRVPVPASEGDGRERSER